MRQILCVAVLLLAACPEGTVGPQGPKGEVGPAGYSPLASGTRIKARVGTTADGAKMFLGWFDAERQESCSFRTAADGKPRCLPDVYVSGAGSPGLRFFSDADCSSLVILAPTCVKDGTCETPSLALYSPSATATANGGAPLWGVYETAGVVSGQKYYELLESGGCVESRVWPYLLIKDEVSPNAFPALEETIE